MKKTLKIILILIGTITILNILDLIAIFTINRPILAIKDNCDCTYQKYIGLLYNTYNCPEYSVPQIKSKKEKFTCAEVQINIDEIQSIVDTSKENKDFACAEALEEFYKDKNYTYYYPCMKSEYIIVTYSSGYTETVSSALKNNSIKITDLDKYNIQYIKYENME